MNKLLDRIVIDPQIIAGKPIIKGTRLTVQFILGLLAQWITTDEILRNIIPWLKKIFLHACLLHVMH